MDHASTPSSINKMGTQIQVVRDLFVKIKFLNSSICGVLMAEFIQRNFDFGFKRFFLIFLPLAILKFVLKKTDFYAELLVYPTCIAQVVFSVKLPLVFFRKKKFS